MSVYKRIFNHLVTLGIYNSTIEVPSCRLSLSLGYMDLVAERLAYLDHGATERAEYVYLLAHYVVQISSLSGSVVVMLVHSWVH